MTIKYFQDTDTLHVEFRVAEVAETRDLDENTQLDLDKHGNICGMTIEHAKDRADIPHSRSSRLPPNSCSAAIWRRPPCLIRHANRSASEGSLLEKSSAG